MNFPYDMEKLRRIAEEREAERRAQAAAEAPEKQQPVPEEIGERRELPIAALEDFPAELHKFHPASRERLEELKDSIRANGIISPLIVRPLDADRYQIIAGHNRRTAARELGYDTVPVIVKRYLTDGEAIRLKNDDNLMQRDGMLPSERGWAYRQNMEVLSNQGNRSDLTCGQNGHKLKDETTCGPNGRKVRASLDNTQTGRSVSRYIRLTYLIPELLDLVDKKQLGLTVGENLSYLTVDNQETVYLFCFTGEKPVKLTEAVAKTLREIQDDPDRIIDADTLEELTAKHTRTRMRSLKLDMQELRTYFPVGTPEGVVVQTIHTALAKYFDKGDV